MRILFAAVCLLSIMNFISKVQADEKLEGIACRSVHLAYSAPAGTRFYNEVMIEKSAPGTYFCVCGFNSGYFGLQELANGKKLVIFSVWDSNNTNDPKSVPEEKRVKNLHKGDGVRIGRFGGEGTGGQSFYDFDWQPNTPYRFMVEATPVGEDRVAFSGYVYLPEKKSWFHMVTFSTITDKKMLGGYYSFVEDFKRDRASAKITRQAKFGHGAVCTEAGNWSYIQTARFTADSNPVLNIDAGPTEDDTLFWLATGGEIKNEHVKLRDKFELKGPIKEGMLTDLPAVFKVE